MFRWLLVSVILQIQLCRGWISPTFRSLYNVNRRKLLLDTVTRQLSNNIENNDGISDNSTQYGSIYRQQDLEDASNVDDTAYRSKSVAWTRRYRSLLPYSEAVKRVHSLGLRSKEEWDEYVADGKPFHGPYLPNHPNEMYADEWISWEEFLGLTRSYEETRNIVVNVLKLQNIDEYEAFVEADVKRAEALRIPAVPRKVYDSEWVSYSHFFGTDDDDEKA